MFFTLTATCMLVILYAMCHHHHHWWLRNFVDGLWLSCTVVTCVTLYGAVFHFIGLLISRCEVLVEVVAEAMCVSGDIFKVCYVRLSLNCVV